MTIAELKQLVTDWIAARHAFYSNADHLSSIRPRRDSAAERESRKYFATRDRLDAAPALFVGDKTDPTFVAVNEWATAHANAKKTRQ